MLDIKNFSHLNNETPNLNDSFFSINKKYKNNKKILIISGGSRNGNHLVTSILDGHPQLPTLPGEDKVLSSVFWNFFLNKKKILNDLKSNENYKAISKLSGEYFDKWKRISKKNISKIHLRRWAGNHPQNFVPLIEHPDQNFFNFEYKNYLRTLKVNFNIEIKNFNDLFINYLDAYSKLTRKKNDKLKFDYIYASSGLRRELYYLLKKGYNVKCIVPIRKFETFYFSKAYGRYKTVKVNYKLLKMIWPHWRNKTIDYLILKKMFPKKILLVKYEDLSNNNSKILKKICNFLDIKFDKSLNIKTFNNLNVKPNSSFSNKKIKNKNKFPSDQLPTEYYEIYKYVNKMSI